MLVKRELLGIPVPDMPKLAQKTRGRLRAAVVDLPKSGKILACFYWVDEKLQARCFIDGKNYATYLEESGNWSKAAPYDYWNSSRRPKSAAEDDETVRNYLEPEAWRRNQSAGYLLTEFIQRWNSDRRWKATQAKWARTERHAQMLPGRLPEDLKVWLNEKILLPQSVILTEKRKDGKVRIKCLHCGRIHSPAEAPKHKQIHRCPKCNTDTKAISQRYASFETAKEEANIAFCCKTGAATLFIYAKAERRLNRELKYAFSYDPGYFEIEEGEKINSYKYIHQYGWCDARYTPVENVHIYPDGIELMWSEKVVDAVKLLDGKAVVLESLLESLKMRSVTMKLLKYGFLSLAPDARYLPDSEKFEDVFGISKNYIHACRRWDINHRELQMLQIADCWVDDELFAKIRFLQEGVGYLTSRSAQTLLQKMSFRKMVGYFYRQKEKTGRDFCTMKDWYMDYLKMHEQLIGDVPKGRDAFPKDLKKAHDKLCAQVKIKGDAYKDGVIRGIYEAEHQKMEFCKAGLIVRMPESIGDFVFEGQQLGHCVGSNSYHAEKHMMQRIMVFFIRKQETPNTPYFTFSVNMETYECTECYGKAHKTATKEITEFINAFIDNIQKKERKAA